MKSRSLLNSSRHLLAAIIGLSTTIGLLSVIPMLSSIAYQEPIVSPTIVLDLVEMPKPRPEAPQKAQAPVHPTKNLPQPAPKAPPQITQKMVKVKKVLPPTPVQDQPSLKAEAKPPPKITVEKIPQEVEPLPSMAQQEVQYPIPTPIFKLSTMPQFLHRETPVFPDKMKKMGISATVKLSALIDRKGTVRKVEVIESAGPEFDSAAITALQRSTFSPGRKNDKPVAVMLRLPVCFRLL